MRHLPAPRGEASVGLLGRGCPAFGDARTRCSVRGLASAEPSDWCASRPSAWARARLLRERHRSTRAAPLRPPRSKRLPGTRADLRGDRCAILRSTSTQPRESDSGAWTSFRTTLVTMEPLLICGMATSSPRSKRRRTPTGDTRRSARKTYSMPSAGSTKCRTSSAPEAGGHVRRG